MLQSAKTISSFLLASLVSVDAIKGQNQGDPSPSNSIVRKVTDMNISHVDLSESSLPSNLEFRQEDPTEASQQDENDFIKFFQEVTKPQDPLDAAPQYNFPSEILDDVRSQQHINVPEKSTGWKGIWVAAALTATTIGVLALWLHRNVTRKDDSSHQDSNEENNPFASPKSSL